LLAKIGPQARAASLYLRFDIGVTCRKAMRAFAGLTNLAFTPAALLGFEKQAAALAEPLAADVASKLRACDNTHADETYWGIDGQPGFGWFHGNERLAHFRIVPTRSGKVSRAILGEDYQGNLTTDCYAGYDAHKTKTKQKCLAHVKRTAEQWYGRVPEEARQSRIFFKSVERWAKSGCRWHRKWKNRTGLKQEQEASWLRKELDRLEQMPVDSKRAETLQKRLRRYHGEWLTFLIYPDVSPTNNLAEQALRALVILRKVSFGSRTRAGAKRMGTLMTVIETAKRQGKSVLKFLAALFTLPANRAARALYARP
jgi:transposase